MAADKSTMEGRLTHNPVRGRRDPLGVIWSIFCTIAAGPALLLWGPAAVGLVIAGSAGLPLIRGRAFLFWRRPASDITIVRFLEGLQARAYALLILAVGLGWYAWFSQDFPIDEWRSPLRSLAAFEDVDQTLKQLSR